MTIRFSQNKCQKSRQNRRGISLTELAFALLVIGAVLGVLWEKVGDVYENLDNTQARQELWQLVQNIRQRHPSDLLSLDENLSTDGLSKDMVGHFKGRAIILNPWNGGVTAFPGNALGGGLDTDDDELTIRFDGVPKSSCANFILETATSSMRDLGLIGILIAAPQAKGKEICFATDALCKNKVSYLVKSQVEAFCDVASNHMTVMFTYAAH